MNRNVLVTGVAGLIGSHIAETLLNNGEYVVGVDSFIGGYRDSVPKHTNFKLIEGDICNLELMNKVCYNCKTVYHCAALAYEGLSVFSPYTIVSNIVSGTVSVASAAIANRVTEFINFSSMARYGNISTPYHESQFPDPVDPYGIAKVAAERQLNMLGQFYGMKVIQIVPHNVIGPRQKYDDPFRNVASIMINRMLQGQQPIIYGDGTQVRCFSHIDEIIPIILKIKDSAFHAEVFNVGPDVGRVSINDLAKLIASLIGFDLHPIYVTSRPCEIKTAWCSSEKIRRRFGFIPTMSLLDGLKTIIDYIKPRGPLPFNYHLPIEIQNTELPLTWKNKLI